MRVAPDELRRGAEVFLYRSQAVRHSLLDLAGDTEPLRQAWQGGGRAAFERNFQGLCALMEREIAILESISLELRSAAEAYERSDAPMDGDDPG
jgi:WXG100 family type VII secretion target